MFGMSSEGDQAEVDKNLSFAAHKEEICAARRAHYKTHREDCRLSRLLPEKLEENARIGSRLPGALAFPRQMLVFIKFLFANHFFRVFILNSQRIKKVIDCFVTFQLHNFGS
jgi:hypothetical protein